MLEFEVEISSRPLGVRFAHADRGETVVVHLVLEDKLGHKLGLLPGDILISVNNKSVLDVSSSEALSQFRATKCPFKARFRRFEDDDEFNTSEDEDNDETNENNDNDDDNEDNDTTEDEKKLQKKATNRSQEYQREQMAQIQYNLSKQVPSSLLKNISSHKRQESISLITWSIKDVQEWLNNIGDNNEFKKYIKIFNDNKIDGKKLNSLDKVDLAKIGINKDDIQVLYNEIQKSNKIFINPPNNKNVQKSQLSKQIKEANIIDDDNNDKTNEDDEDENNEDDDNDDNDNNDKDDNKNETDIETGDNWEAPFLPYMYDAPTIKLSSKTLVKVYTYRIVSPYKKRAFALYEIEVIDGKEEWLLSKRYSEFYRLYESMKKLNVKTKITFPKKGLFTKSTDKQVMEDRKKKLTNYLNELLKEHKIARDSKELNDFLSPTRTFVVDE